MNKNYFTVGSVSSVLALLIMGLTAIGLVYILFVERPPLRYMNSPFPVLKNQVYPGDVLPLSVSRCSDANGRRVITSTRYLENIGDDDDQEVLVLDMIAAIIPPGCVTQLVKIHRIPALTPPGTYRFIGATIVPGLIRDFQIEWSSAPFQVVAKPVPVPTQPMKTPP